MVKEIKEKQSQSEIFYGTLNSLITALGWLIVGGIIFAIIFVVFLMV